MTDEFVAEVKSRGYWRINFRPVVRPDAPLSLSACLDIVRNNAVRFGGWSYPFVPSQSEAGSQGIDWLDRCVQGWNTYYYHIEFWRLYTSQQFISYVGLTEDWKSQLPGYNSSEEAPEGTSLGVMSAISKIGETFEFLYRLMQQGFYGGGSTISIELRNTEGRQLVVDEQGRMPFFAPRSTQAKDIVYQKSLSVADVQDPRSLAKEGIMYIFDRFGWDPNGSQLASDIDRLYNHW